MILEKGLKMCLILFDPQPRPLKYWWGLKKHSVPNNFFMGGSPPPSYTTAAVVLAATWIYPNSICSASHWGANVKIYWNINLEMGILYKQRETYCDVLWIHGRCTLTRFCRHQSGNVFTWKECFLVEDISWRKRDSVLSQVRTYSEFGFHGSCTRWKSMPNISYKFTN